MTNVNNELAEANEQLISLQNQIEQINSEEEINNIIQSATNYWDNSNFLQSLTLLKNPKSQSADIDTLYKQYSEKYSLYLLSQSDILISERNYEEAIKVLNEGKSLVFDCKLIEDKLESINNNKPIKLSNLKISASRFFSQNTDKTIEDTVGNKYTSGNSFIMYAEGDSNYGYATFYLGQKYSSFSGVIAVSDESENRSDVQLKGWIEIYSKNGEEYNQLWSSELLSRTTSTVPVSDINLSGIEWLEIRYYDSGNYFSLAGGYHSLRIIIANGTLYID